MWRKPELLAADSVDKIWPMGFTAPRFWRQPFLTYSDTTAPEGALELVQRLYSQAANMCERHMASLTLVDALSAVPPIEFQRDYLAIASRAASEIESRRRYDLVWGIYLVRIEMGLAQSAARGTNEQTHMDILVSGLIRDVHLLVGKEDLILVGCKNALPAWKKIPKVYRQDQARRLVEHVSRTPPVYMPYISQADVDVVPAPHEWAQKGSVPSWPEVDYKAAALRLMEDAFYNQRYVVDPVGALVRVKGWPGVSSLILKVRPALRDRDYLDFLVRLELENGSGLVIVTEAELFPREGTLSNRTIDPLALSSQRWILGEQQDAFRYLAAQIYHDLVTAVELPGISPILLPESVGHELPPQHVPSWTVIPRSFQGRIHQPREELETPRFSDPHRVRGHKRKGRMTEEHKEEILRFEQKTGLQVLRFIPEGYTFVRPHISPSITPEELLGLPRFIRLRMQQALQQALSGLQQTNGMTG